MHMDPIMPYLAGTVFAVVVLGLLLRRLGQPVVVGYLLTGIALGPYGLGLLEDRETMEHLGSLGVLLLLFFVGMEITPRDLLARWRVAILGTGLQVGISLACVAGVGAVLDWQPARIVLLGFVISLSSTAVVLKLFQGGREDDEVARDVTSVLLAQDVAVVPMLVVVGLLAGGPVDPAGLALQIVGALGMLALLVWLTRSETVHLPFRRALDVDPELQVFVALMFCFGFGMLAAVLQLSAALGAFAAGLLVGVARETHRFHVSTKPLEVVFVAAFFVSVGMLIDLEFLRANWITAVVLVVLVVVTNTGVNALVFRLLGSSWKRAFHAASLLSQIGEFSFVLAQVGLHAAIITEYGYRMAIAVIALSLSVSPPWIALVRRLTRERAPAVSGA